MKKLISKIKIFISSIYWYKYLLAKYRKKIVEKDPETEMRRVYTKVFDKEPDLEHPKDLIEKIYWMQLHGDTSLWTRCADKYAAALYTN